jgi:RNA polymerase sigma factor (sigma-70 family)
VVNLVNQDTQILYGLKSGYSERITQEKVLYLQYSYFIDKGCYKYNISYEDSFSVYSDAVLATIHNIVAGNFDGRSSLKTYLFQIYSNKCVDLLRKNTTKKQRVNELGVVPELLEQLPDSAKTIIEKLMDDQKRKALKEQLDQIGEKCKDILLLFEDGLTDKEIAGQLLYNNAAVAKTTRLRCLEKLREKMSFMLKFE